MYLGIGEIMKIAYTPYNYNGNKYITISENALQDCGAELYEFNSKTINKETDAVFLNWYESVGRSKYPFRTLYLINKRKMVLRLIHKKGICIVTTFHNKVPHDISGFYGKLNQELLRFVLNISDYIITLNNHSLADLEEYIDKTDIEKKAFLIPHPNYIGAYSEPIVDVEYNYHKKMKILFAGQIRKYKNIELLLQAADKVKDLDIEFIIAGKCQTLQYKEYISKLIEEKNNVNGILRFIEDKELEGLVRESDLLVLPYNIASSMNSGTVILAFSNGRSVICPEIATIKDYDAELTYSYKYTSEEEHIVELEKKIRMAYDDWKNRNEEFTNKGKILFEEVKIKNSYESIKERYSLLLEKINNI